MVKKIVNIGEELVGHSKEADTSRRGLADELFPYIWVASKKMSTRAISRWLEEKQGLQLSAATIAKVLRETDTRMRNYFLDMRKKETGFYSMIDSVQVHPGSPTALFDQDRFEVIAAVRNEPGLAMLVRETVGGRYARLLELYNALKDEWFALPVEFRDECKKYVSKKDLEEVAAGADDFIIRNSDEQKREDGK